MSYHWLDEPAIGGGTPHRGERLVASGEGRFVSEQCRLTTKRRNSIRRTGSPFTPLPKARRFRRGALEVCAQAQVERAGAATDSRTAVMNWTSFVSSSRPLVRSPLQTSTPNGVTCAIPRPTL